MKVVHQVLATTVSVAILCIARDARAQSLVGGNTAQVPFSTHDWANNPSPSLDTWADIKTLAGG